MLFKDFHLMSTNAYIHGILRYNQCEIYKFNKVAQATLHLAKLETVF